MINDKLSFSNDWRKIEKLFVVYPSMRPNLIDEVLKLLLLISNTCQLEMYLILKDKEAKDDFLQKINNFEGESILIQSDKVTLNGLTILFWEIDVNDIWIRDYAPISLMNNASGVKLTKAIYNPSYGFNTAIDNNVGMKIFDKFTSNEPNKLLPFKLDGGNVISNGKYVICSEKLFAENYDLTSKDIINYFREHFDSELIIIPTEPLDIIGHADSLVRFLDEKTVLLPSYPDADCYRVETRYVNEMYGILTKNLPLDYNYIFIPSDLSDNISDEGIISAEYCYLNYLRIQNNLYIPSFENMEEEQREIKKNTSQVQ